MPGTVSQESIETRVASLQDAADVARLGSHIFASTFGYSLPPHDLKAYLDEFYSTEAMIEDMEDPMKDLIVAISPEGVIVGFALLTRGTVEPCVSHLQNTIELQRIYVHPDHHGKGVGKILANRLDDIARKQDFEYIWLGVWEENYRAQKVYEKLGYSRVGSHGFSMGNTVQTDLIMLKKL